MDSTLSSNCHAPELRIRQKCLDCDLRRSGFFCNLPIGELVAFDALTITRVFPRDSTLFLEGQPASGIFVICQGRVKLSTCSRDGKKIVVAVAEPGEVLGLSSIMAGFDHEVTAEAIEISQVDHIPADKFLSFIEENPAASIRAIRQLSRNYHEAHKKLCSFGTAEPVVVKLAKLFLEWCSRESSKTTTIHMQNQFTHEEIAEMIGASRETVTRALREMRERGLLTLKGSELDIHNRRLLEVTAERPF
ncbi:MAG: Crp/Fnr family transcriptional regulator [Pyrinomonadaceae bacterium]